MYSVPLVGRVDHAISTLWTMMRPDLAPLIPYVVFEDATNVVNFIQPGTYTIEKMDFTKYLSFISMTPVENVTLVDVKYTLDSKSYAYPVALVSNEFTSDKMTISFTKGLILVAQTPRSLEIKQNIAQFCAMFFLFHKDSRNPEIHL